MSIFLPSSIPLRLPFAHYKQFNYAKAVRISNSGSKLTNYQVKIELNNTNFPFSKCRSDGYDIRFVSDNRNTLDFWTESWSSTAATIWVEVDEIPAYADKIIWLIYGNPDASSVSDGDATFEFFDDFEYSDSPSDHGWTIGAGDTFETQTTHVKLGVRSAHYGSSAQYADTYHPIPSISKGVLEFDYRSPEDTDIVVATMLSEVVGTSAVKFFQTYLDNPGDFLTQHGDTIYVLQAYTSSTWYKIEIQFDTATDKQNIWIDDVQKDTDGAFHNPVDNILYFGLTMNGKYHPGDVYYDNIRVRKYADPEPTIQIL